MIINFTGGVLPYKRHRYQEGNEADCELKCSDGSVMVRKYRVRISSTFSVLRPLYFDIFTSTSLLRLAYYA